MCIGWQPCMIFIAGIYECFSESFTIAYISWLQYIHDIYDTPMYHILEPKWQLNKHEKRGERVEQFHRGQKGLRGKKEGCAESKGDIQRVVSEEEWQKEWRGREARCRHQRVREKGTIKRDTKERREKVGGTHVMTACAYDVVAALMLLLMASCPTDMIIHG